MSEPESPAPAEPPAPADSLDEVRGLLGRATQHLLGATIELDDEQWRQPSRLPGWSRGHVGSHLARNAEAIGRLADWAATGEEQQLYPSAEQRDADIEAGAGRPGLEMQIDLDSTAGALDQRFARLDESDGWRHPVTIRDSEVPARLLPLFRLTEVVLHHVDLDVGFGVDDIDDDTCTWLLEYLALRLADRADLPRLALSTDDGFHATVGGAQADGASTTAVSGPAPQVLGWLTGRTGPDRLTGADGVDLPSIP